MYEHFEHTYLKLLNYIYIYIYIKMYAIINIFVYNQGLINTPIMYSSNKNYFIRNCCTLQNLVKNIQYSLFHIIHKKYTL